jgi:hypothetical protein
MRRGTALGSVVGMLLLGFAAPAAASWCTARSCSVPRTSRHCRPARRLVDDARGARPLEAPHSEAASGAAGGAEGSERAGLSGSAEPTDSHNTFALRTCSGGVTPVPPRRPSAAGAPITGVRERAAHALDDDFPAVLAALRRGLDDKDAGKAARTAVAYVQLVYGRQLHSPRTSSRLTHSTSLR